MGTQFRALRSLLEDITDEIAVDVNSVRAAVKSRGARLGSTQRAALLGIREEADDLIAMADELLGTSSAIKSVGSLASTDVVTNVGSAIKSLGGGYVGGYLVKFGGKGDLSQWRDVFTKSTYYGRSKRVDAYLHHAMLDTPGGDQPLTNEAELGMDDVGITVKLLLNLRSKYERALADLVEQDKLGWSSGAPAHLVKRERQRDGSHVVKRWPIAEASLTPTPAGGRGMEARAALKSLLVEAVARPQIERPPALLIPGPTSGSYIDLSDHWGLGR